MIATGGKTSKTEQHIAFYRQLRDRLVNLRRILTSDMPNSFSESFNICRDLSHYSVKLSEHTLRHEIIMIVNQLQAAIQIMNDPETGDTGREAVQSILNKISQTLTGLIDQTDNELSKNNAAITEKQKPVVLDSFQSLGEHFKEKETPLRLIGSNTELSFQQSIELLDEYNKRVNDVPIKIDSDHVLFRAPLLIRMRFNVEKLSLVKEMLINTKVGYGDNWILDNAWIVALHENDVDILSDIANKVSQQLEDIYITTHAQWGTWRMPGSPLTYSWLMNLHMYTALQPKIYNFSFPFQTTPTSSQHNIRRQAAKRIQLESGMREDRQLFGSITNIYHSLLAERRALEEEVVQKEIVIKDLQDKIAECEDAHSRILLRGQITKANSSIIVLKNKIKDKQQQVDIVRRDRNSVGQQLPQREDDLRELIRNG